MEIINEYDNSELNVCCSHVIFISMLLPNSYIIFNKSEGMSYIPIRCLGRDDLFSLTNQVPGKRADVISVPSLSCVLLLSGLS